MNKPDRIVPRRKIAAAVSPAAATSPSTDLFRVEGSYTGEGKPTEVADLPLWVLSEGRDLPSEAALFDGLCWRLLGQGVPLSRATLHIGTLHPQIRGFGCRWWRDRALTEEFQVAHGADATDEYLHSPIRPVIEYGAFVRHQLDRPWPDLPLLDTLRAQGATDYIAAPLNATYARYPAVTWTTDRPGGFTRADLCKLDAVRPALASVIETRSVRRIAGNLLDTYLGHQVGRRILDGQILRGHGERLRAVVMASDLRGFTRLSDRLPGEDVIDMLDDYFEQVAAPVKSLGGEVLKFVGDGVLAIFPAEDGAETDAAQTGLKAASAALAGLEALNGSTERDGRAPLRAGFGLHLGEVIYGNVGSPDRLDFTVIGPAVNLACRLEGLTKRFNRPILMSSAFAAACPAPLVSLGFQPIRGIADPEELFAPPE
jgi:adenylate cyclase